MPTNEPLPDRCAIEVRNGDGYCANYPVNGASTCRMHGGTGGAPEGNTNGAGHNAGGAPEGNTNAMKHGVQADPENFYDTLDDDAQAWIDDLAARYQEFLGFDDDDSRNERLRRACIHMYQSWIGEERILEEGMSEEIVIGETANGKPVATSRTHHLNRYMLARDQEARQILEDLGAFDSE